MAPGPAKNPEEAAERSSFEKITFQQALEERIAQMEGRKDAVDTRREKRALQRLLSSYKAERLKQTIETHTELAKLRQSVESYFEGDVDLDAEGLKSGRSDMRRAMSAVDSLLRKEEAEDVINRIPGFSSVLGNIEKVDDLNNLTVEQLMALEKKYEGILLYAFTDFADSNKKIDWNDFKTFYDVPKPGQMIQIDFRGHAGAERAIGAADFLPPSVRRITVYESGDKNRARTSLRRIGLKGENKYGRGFFDNDGYIPVYSGDVIVVGGDAKSGEGIDTDFEKKYQDYEKSEAAKEDEKFIRQLQERNPDVPMSELEAADVDKIMRNFNTTKNGARVVETVLREVGNRSVTGKCCWDWVRKIYRLAGMNLRRVYQNLNYSGKDCRQYFKDNDSAREYRDQFVRRIEPGDWLYINNRNKFDTKGCHSVIFLRWIEPNKVAQVASAGKSGQPGRTHTVNIDDKQITHISKPIPA